MVASYRPRAELPTHAVTNQPPPLVDYNLFTIDPVLADVLQPDPSSETSRTLVAYGAALGAAEMLEAGDVANRHPPEFKPFDRYGHRIDEVAFHPAYHQLMALAMSHGQHSLAWEAGGSHTGHAALEFLTHQVEAGICCPLSMTYAGLPVLKRHHPALFQEWSPKLTSRTYDPASRPVTDKRGATMGMAMTEKQGGSDVRANGTMADHVAADRYRLTGHKWFCSAPMCDAFLTLAYAPEGLSCFFVPRWTDDGQRNAIYIQRLKDKLGNRSNASAEIEYHGAEAVLVGEPGRGIVTIIEMVHHTRLSCTIGAASLMRAAVTQALHHAKHRRAFQKPLIQQPLMRSVLGDLLLEAEAATRLAFRVAQAFDDPAQTGFARIAVSVAKYWLNKRVGPFVYECLEVHGGAGYVEESPMPRLYREAPLNGIWEGSGNVICLDVLRALDRDPEASRALLDTLNMRAGHGDAYDGLLSEIVTLLKDPANLQANARALVERLGVALQAGLLIDRHGVALADHYIQARLGGSGVHGSRAGQQLTDRLIHEAVRLLP